MFVCCLQVCLASKTIFCQHIRGIEQNVAKFSTLPVEDGFSLLSLIGNPIELIQFYGNPSLHVAISYSYS